MEPKMKIVNAKKEANCQGVFGNCSFLEMEDESIQSRREEFKEA